MSKPWQVGDRVRCLVDGELGRLTSVTPSEGVVRLDGGAVIFVASRLLGSFFQRVE